MLWRILLSVMVATLLFTTPVWAKGRVEHHQMTSRILADAGQPADRELSVYLPEEYDAGLSCGIRDTWWFPYR